MSDLSYEGVPLAWVSRSCMEILYLLIPLGVLVMIIALFGLIWAIRSGQFDDMEGPAHRIIMDDDDPLVPKKVSTVDKEE